MSLALLHCVSLLSGAGVLWSTAHGASPADFGDQLLVILASRTDPADVPDNVVAADALPGVDVHQLPSASFKNLMPCYTVTVATSTDVPPRGLSAQLKRVGIDHYLKPAGRYVGERPELAATCGAVHSPPTGASTVAFGEASLGFVMPVNIDIAGPILDPDQPFSRVDPEGSVWRAARPETRVGTLDSQSTVTAIDYATGPSTCTLGPLSAGIAGRVHFSFSETGPPAAPVCGRPMLIGGTGCTGDVVVLSGTPAAGTWAGPWESRTAAQLSAPWSTTLSDLATEAEAKGGPVTQKVRRRPVTLPTGPAWVVELTVMTGEGFWVCGGEDHFAVHVGLQAADGTVLVGPQDITGSEVLGVLDVAGTGAWSIHSQDEITLSQRLQGGSSAQYDRAYCDCPC